MYSDCKIGFINHDFEMNLPVEKMAPVATASQESINLDDFEMPEDDDEPIKDAPPQKEQSKTVTADVNMVNEEDDAIKQRVAVKKQEVAPEEVKHDQKPVSNVTGSSYEDAPRVITRNASNVQNGADKELKKLVYI